MTTIISQIEALAENFEFIEDGEGRLRVRAYSVCSKLTDADRTFIAANKPAIFDWLRQKTAHEAAERARKNAWKEENGVAAIEEAVRAQSAWEDSVKAAMDRGDGKLPAPFTGPAPEDLMRQYPAGAAYVRMDLWAASAQYRKAAIGRAACERLLAGEDYAAVLAAAENEWKEAAMEHLWD